MAKKAQKPDTFKEVVDKIWPKTKKELEKMAENAKKMLAKGEEHLRDWSEKGIEKTKKLSLSIKREQMYYTLGKISATTPATKWRASKKISSTLKEIKELDRQIKKIK